jgi:hypothetical protein
MIISHLFFSQMVVLSVYNFYTSTSRRPSRAGQTSSSEPQPCRTREQSLSERTQRRQSRGRRCDRHPDKHVSMLAVPMMLQETDNGVVTTDGARGRGERVGGAEEDTAGLDGVTTLPDHGADGAATHVCTLSV